MVPEKKNRLKEKPTKKKKKMFEPRIPRTTKQWGTVAQTV